MFRTNLLNLTMLFQLIFQKTRRIDDALVRKVLTRDKCSVKSVVHRLRLNCTYKRATRKKTFKNSEFYVALINDFGMD